MSRREKNISLNDQLATIGGILGLFTGMSILGIADILLFSYTIIKSILNDFVHMLRTPNSKSKLLYLKRNGKKPKSEMKMECCNKQKICHNEEHVKNLYVSSILISNVRSRRL